MEKEEISSKAGKVARELCDIILKHEPDDLSGLKEWLEKNNTAGETIQMLTKGHELAEKIEYYKQSNKEYARKQLQARIRKYEQRRHFFKISGLAASIILLLGATGLITYFFSSHDNIPPINKEHTISVPTLITAKGESIKLSFSNRDSILMFEGNHIIKNNEGLEYIQDNKVLPSVNENFDQLIIPKQCNYQVILCDGSKVHLNAVSRLEFPPQFSGNERKVRLSGEGFFEIKHDGRPFIVEVGQISIRVYGTKFNINSYDPTCVETVLATGAIGVSFTGTPHKESILKPNQICTMNLQTRQQTVRNVEITNHISWTTGYLRYDNDLLEKLMKDLGRWYGEEFDFMTSDLKTIRISASINKDLPLSEVLEMIQTTAKIKIYKKERRYIISR